MLDSTYLPNCLVAVALVCEYVVCTPQKIILDTSPGSLHNQVLYNPDIFTLFEKYMMSQTHCIYSDYEMFVCSRDEKLAIDLRKFKEHRDEIEKKERKIQRQERRKKRRRANLTMAVQNLETKEFQNQDENEREKERKTKTGKEGIIAN